MTIFREIPRSVRVVTGPLYEPISVADAARWCNIDDDLVAAAQPVLALLIASARERAEDITGRAFIERDLELVLDDLPDGDSVIELPLSPVQSVSYIRYTDAAGDEQELSGSPTAWNLDTASTPARLCPLPATSWPGTQQTVGNVRIGFRCGYGPVVGSPNGEADNQALVPGRIRNWLAVRISTFYEMRESIIVGGQMTEVPRDYVDGLLDGLIVHRRFA